MKKYNSILRSIFVAAASLFVVTGCVHDDKYDQPNLDGYDCADKKGIVMPFADVKAKYDAKNNVAYVFPEDKTPNDESDDLYMVGYVSSSDETGNIYKTIYIQDALENPTHGFTISVDAVSTYTRYPQGSKVYVKLNGLAVGNYGTLVQLGVRTGTEASGSVSRIPEKLVGKYIFRSCGPKGKIIPKVMKLADMSDLTDQYLGCLIEVNDVEFDARALCTTYAPNGVTVDKTIGEGWAGGKYAKTAVVRNSGYASFANQLLPSGKGQFVGIYSKFKPGTSATTYQLYINRPEDLTMKTFPRIDLLTESPCDFNPSKLTPKTVADIKQLVAGTTDWVQITGDYSLTAQVVANDETGNIYKYVYVEDATGGIRINMNKTNLYLDSRFRLGKDVNIKLKNLYVRNVNGEIQIGALFSNNTKFGQIEEADMYKYFFDSNTAARPVVPTERTIPQLSMADVGRWIKIKDVQFVNGDLGRTLTDGTNVTARTLEDCSGNKVILKTSGQAKFGNTAPGSYEVKGGKGDVYAALSIENGVYQLWITRLAHIDFDAPRCDGSVYTPLPVIYSYPFAAGGFGDDWTAVNKVGPQVWQTSNQGNGINYYASMNGNAGGAGNNIANEDWLISKAVNLAGKTKAAVSFTTDVRYSGNALQVYATDNYTGDVATTNWILLPVTLDTNSNAFGDWVGSGNVDLSAFLGKNVRIAFKYTSTTSAAATWQVDDFKIKGQ